MTFFCSSVMIISSFLLSIILLSVYKDFKEWISFEEKKAFSKNYPNIYALKVLKSAVSTNEPLRL